ncbi:Uncharacterised protein [Mycobacteroides abscessus subsp. abscessus]|uniref:VG15 protein n=1 Tax=Mycobacteroides abscessus TaxID=36809 RepID=UPI00092C3619|nr:hypothetical protein [Mycobacteroides abscessus]SHT11530.1 Uncharacterised protein [Mycobacteroides abscessus subsp. abscessus]SKO61882.1 Uncharacterised protein [Mycobacteroides abscessus subsp. abscessus]
MTAPQEQGSGLKALEAYVAYRTLKHSEDQDAIAAGLALKLYPIWLIQRFDELDRTTPLWVSSALPLVKTAYLQSQRAAAVFASDVRNATLSTEDFLPMDVPVVEVPSNISPLRFSDSLIPSVSLEHQPLVEFDPFPEKDVATSLVINGNYEIKASMPGPQEDLMYSGLSNSSGAAIRQAMNGGRNVTGNVVYADRKIIGYARVTDGNPCWFCALLASRGAVFRKSSFKGGRANPWNGSLTKGDQDFIAPKDGPELPEGFSNVAKVHNHCRCQLRPVYAREKSFGQKHEAIRDEEAQFYFDQWDKVSREWYWLSNKDQAAKFREQYTPFKRTTPDLGKVRKELESRSRALLGAGFSRNSPQVEWANTRLSQLAA